MANKLNDRLKAVLANTRSRVIFIVVTVVVLGGIVTGALLGYQSYKYVSTDNAEISGARVDIDATAASQIISLDVDYGSYVEKGQEIATVGQPRPNNQLIAGMGLNETPEGSAAVESPVNGYVAAVWAYPGQVMEPGTLIVTLFDISDTWAIANVSEDDLYKIEPGQPVDVTVDSLGGLNLKGSVVGIAAASAATFSLLPANNTTGNFIKVTQLVPIKISIENPAHYILIPGTSVEVKIAVR
jgi:multidrug resistance efflux pump